MTDTPPDIVDRYTKAAGRRDFGALAACFTDDAIVSDENHTHRGRDEIKKWQETTRTQWDYVATVVGGEWSGDDEYVSAVRLEGNFPGGVADVTYRFALRDGLISRLRIG